MSEQKTPIRRGRKKQLALYTPISFIVIVAALIFGMSVFFKVSKVEVEGESFYSAEEIIEASGVMEGDNLFFINRSSIASLIISKLPYIESVRVNRALPNRVVIQISESTGAAYVLRQGEFWIVDRNCKVLGTASVGQAEGLVRIDGLDITEPMVGSILDEEVFSGKISFLSSILFEMSERNMLADVGSIDISNVASPIFEYQGRFTVRIGKNEDIEYKFALLVAAVSQLSDNETGIFDLSIDKNARFIPG